jgi:Spy/CpxP family protein refolding chaperone
MLVQRISIGLAVLGAMSVSQVLPIAILATSTAQAQPSLPIQPPFPLAEEDFGAGDRRELTDEQRERMSNIRDNLDDHLGDGELEADGDFPMPPDREELTDEQRERMADGGFPMSPDGEELTDEQRERVADIQDDLDDELDDIDEGLAEDMRDARENGKDVRSVIADRDLSRSEMMRVRDAASNMRDRMSDVLDG